MNGREATVAIYDELIASYRADLTRFEIFVPDKAAAEQCKRKIEMLERLRENFLGAPDD